MVDFDGQDVYVFHILYLELFWNQTYKCLSKFTCSFFKHRTYNNLNLLPLIIWNRETTWNKWSSIWNQCWLAMATAIHSTILFFSSTPTHSLSTALSTTMYWKQLRCAMYCNKIQNQWKQTICQGCPSQSCEKKLRLYWYCPIYFCSSFSSYCVYYYKLHIRTFVHSIKCIESFDWFFFFGNKCYDVQISWMKIWSDELWKNW